jgi:hypothetical protein
MNIVGYVMIALGLVGIVRNLTSVGGMRGPDPAGANRRVGGYVVALIIGGALVALSM